DKPRQADLNVAKTALNLAQAQLDEALHSVDRLQGQIAKLSADNAKNALWMQQLTRDADKKAKDDLNKNPRTAPLAASLPSDTAENAALTSKDFDVQIAQANADAALTQTGNVGAIASGQAQVSAAKQAVDRLTEGADKQDIARVQANLDAAQTALEQAKAMLSKSKLISPIDGTVARLNLNLGEPVPNGPAVIILDTSGYYVELNIDEVHVARISIGQ